MEVFSSTTEYCEFMERELATLKEAVEKYCHFFNVKDLYIKYEKKNGFKRSIIYDPPYHSLIKIS